MSHVWRLILDGRHDGAWNMAVDRAMLEAYAAGSVPATLRLYGWERPTVSLGRFQRAGDVDEAVACDHGVGVCRRPTGGRGVLHDDEVTYAVVSGVRDGLPRGVTASYRMLSGALVEAFRSLGVGADLTSRPRGERRSAACYLHATAADVSVGAAKLSGSAQVWLQDACLQHGSFVLSRDAALEAALFRLTPSEAAALASTTRTIAEVTGARPREQRVAAAVVAGFTRALGVRFVRGALSASEVSRATELVGSYRATGECLR